MKAHWESWFDEEIPALDGMTPREAARSTRGRRLLEDLILEYEFRPPGAPRNALEPNTTWLRSELGL
jgi:hypothetical protein